MYFMVGKFLCSVEYIIMISRFNSTVHCATIDCTDKNVCSIIVCRNIASTRSYVTLSLLLIFTVIALNVTSRFPGSVLP